MIITRPIRVYYSKIVNSRGIENRVRVVAVGADTEWTEEEELPLQGRAGSQENQYLEETRMELSVRCV